MSAISCADSTFSEYGGMSPVGPPDVLREPRERYRIRAELRSVRSALRFVHVTLEAPDLPIDRCADIDTSGRSLPLPDCAV